MSREGAFFGKLKSYNRTEWKGVCCGFTQRRCRPWITRSHPIIQQPRQTQKFRTTKPGHCCVRVADLKEEWRSVISGLGGMWLDLVKVGEIISRLFTVHSTHLKVSEWHHNYRQPEGRPKFLYGKRNAISMSLPDRISTESARDARLGDNKLAFALTLQAPVHREEQQRRETTKRNNKTNV